MTDSPTPDPSPTISPKARGLITRVQDILLRPAPTWDVIDAEPADVKSLYMGYVIPLAAIGPVASIIGISLFTLGFGLIPAVLGGIWGFAVGLAMVYVLALIIDALAPSFDGQKNFLKAFKLAAYSMTAGWVAGIVMLIPLLFFVVILAGLYNLYLFYVGLPKLMKSPPEKSLGYTAVVVIIAIVLGAVAGGVGKMVAGGAALGTFGMMPHGPVVADNGKVSGTVRIGGASVDLGKIQQATDQMAAEASAQQNGTTTVKVADPQVLLALMPASYMGAARTDDSTSSGGAVGITAAQARGSYLVNGNTISLEVEDLGTASGLGAMAAALNVNSSSSSATGYSKISTQNGQMVSEEYDRDSKYGKYSVVRNGRINVEASGTVDSIDTLKNLVNGLDAGKLEGLSKG